MIKPCIQQHFHQLHKSSKSRQQHDAGSQTEMPNNEHAGLFCLVREQMADVSSECWDWTQMSPAVSQSVTFEMKILIPGMTCEMVNQSLMLHQLMACFWASLHTQHTFNVNLTSTTDKTISQHIMVCTVVYM